ncbi:RIP metalloprotease RseP [Candidatus Giovannonibacteria bacterium]|nr:RIP metalloprotease RseP [Candidatus Giovannonibacteria bacterium]
MLVTIAIFLIILLVLVLAHEFGHFLTAKLAGVKVDEFAFGFPPRIASFRKGETRYSFNLLPVGGFVKIRGEEGDGAEDPGSFASQNFFTKVFIIAAGVIFNLILAYFLISGGFMLGTPIPLGDEDVNQEAQIRITEVQRNSPAEAAGLETGDRILELSFDAERLAVAKIAGIQQFISRHKGQQLAVTLERRGKVIRVEARPRLETEPGEGALGIAMMRFGVEKSSFVQALGKGFSSTREMTFLTARGLWEFFADIFSRRASFESVSGPVGIISIVGDFSRFGLVFLIQLTALLSINLALINLIPFPGLDGGRIFFVIMEKVKGSPFNWKVSRAIHAAGFLLLILLMIIVTYHDILKLNS